MKTSVMLVFAFCSVMLTPIASSTTPPGAVLEAFSRIKPLYLGHSYGRDDRSVFYDDIILNSADSSTFRLLVCIDPVNSCSGVNVEGNDDEHPDGRRHQALDSQA